MSITSASRPRASSRSSAVLRRLWILPVSIAVVAALAYAVSGISSSTYSAQSNVVVTSAPGPVGANGASNAASLASTYAGALPNDPALQSYVGNTAHVNPQGTIEALPPKGAVITMHFFGTTRAAALAGGKAIASGLSAARPTSTIVAPHTLEVVQAPVTATLNSTAAVNRAKALTAPQVAPLPPAQSYRYMSEVVLIVPPNGGGPAEGINPSDADHLAQTYAGIIPTDDGLLAAVGRKLGESASTVGQNLSVVNEQNTSLLQITFKASQPDQAAAGARAVARLLSGTSPVAAGIVPSSLATVTLPKNPGPVAKSKGSAIVIGAALGLVLGIVLLIAWERSDPRVRDARELSTHIGCPTTPVDRLSPNAAYALLERWASLTDHVPARVAVLPASAAVQDQAEAVVSELRSAGGRLVSHIDARAGILPEDLANGYAESETGVVLVHAGPPGGESSGEAIALGCDLTVVVVPAGARAADIRQLGEELTSFGIVPVWALLTSGARRPAAQPAQVADAVRA
jgi:capsular polysaccharide biosynthesis protein